MGLNVVEGVECCCNGGIQSPLKMKSGCAPQNDNGGSSEPLRGSNIKFTKYDTENHRDLIFNNLSSAALCVFIFYAVKNRIGKGCLHNFFLTLAPIENDSVTR